MCGAQYLFAFLCLTVTVMQRSAVLYFCTSSHMLFQIVCMELIAVPCIFKRVTWCVALSTVFAPCTC